MKRLKAILAIISIAAAALTAGYAEDDDIVHAVKKLMSGKEERVIVNIRSSLAFDLHRITVVRGAKGKIATGTISQIFPEPAPDAYITYKIRVKDGEETKVDIKKVGRDDFDAKWEAACQKIINVIEAVLEFQDDPEQQGVPGPAA